MRKKYKFFLLVSILSSVVGGNATIDLTSQDRIWDLGHEVRLETGVTSESGESAASFKNYIPFRGFLPADDPDGDAVAFVDLKAKFRSSSAGVGSSSQQTSLDTFVE